MQTDDQLTRALTDAFRTSTDDLTYDRPAPVPRRAGLVTGPLVLAGVAGVAVAVTVHGGGGHPSPQASAPTTTTASATATASTSAANVTRTLTLAGYAFTYSQPAGSVPFSGRFESAVPSAATPVAVGSSTVPMGVDPATGQETAWVHTVDHGWLAISSPDATQDELVALLGSAARAIPVVGAS